MIDGMRLGVSGITPLARQTARRAAGGFNVRTSDDPADTMAADAILEPRALNGLLALQEAQSHDVRERQARRHGTQSLIELGRLQRALLTPGAVPTADLHRLAALSAEVPYTTDPLLRELLAAIALRARVELAKLGDALDVISPHWRPASGVAISPRR